MSDILLTNESLQTLIKETPLISEEQRKQFMERLPYSDREERIGLLKTLKDIILIEAEKNEAIENLKELE